MAIAISELTDQAEREFAFLAKLGYIQAGRELFAESSYRGGFTLTFAQTGTVCVIEYADYELSVSVQGVGVFNATSHPGFFSNTFSREHLAEQLPKIAAEVRAIVTQGTPSAA